MIEIKLKIENIDYDSLADIIAPMLKEKLDNGDFPAWARLLFMAGGMNGDAVRKILSRIPENKREEMIIQLLNKNSKAAAEMLENLAATRGIGIKIGDIEASK